MKQKSSEESNDNSANLKMQEFYSSLINKRANQKPEDRPKEKSAEAWLADGNDFYEQNKKQEAIQCYDKAISINPNSAQAYYHKGNTLKNLGRMQEAIAAYDKAICIKPDYVGAYNNKGNALYALGRNQEALECFDKAIQLNPCYDIGYDNKAEIFSGLGRQEEAAMCAQKAEYIRHGSSYPGIGEAFEAVFKGSLISND